MARVQEVYARPPPETMFKH